MQRSGRAGEIYFGRESGKSADREMRETRARWSLAERFVHDIHIYLISASWEVSKDPDADEILPMS